MKTITLKSGIVLGYHEFGEGDRYLLTASQFTSSKLHYTIDLAEQGFHVFQIRIRGYAPSTLVDEDYGDRWYDIWAQDVADFADAMGIDRFVYAGVSHGAGIGWYLSLYHAKRLHAFISCVGGPHSKDGQDTGEARMQTIEASKHPSTWKEWATNRVLSKAGGYRAMAESGRADPALVEEAIQEQVDFWVNMTPREAAYNPRKPFPFCKTEQELVDTLCKIRLPVLLIGGMQDPISTAENLIRSCRAVKSSKLIIYEEGTHSVMLEKQQECVRDILVFLRDRVII
jgi:pimeloyl-ACP methyl ester carboxylesterase